MTAREGGGVIPHKKKEYFDRWAKGEKYQLKSWEGELDLLMKVEVETWEGRKRGR